MVNLPLRVEGMPERTRIRLRLTKDVANPRGDRRRHRSISALPVWFEGLELIAQYGPVIGEGDAVFLHIYPAHESYPATFSGSLGWRDDRIPLILEAAEEIPPTLRDRLAERELTAEEVLEFIGVSDETLDAAQTALNAMTTPEEQE